MSLPVRGWPCVYIRTALRNELYKVTRLTPPDAHLSGKFCFKEIPARDECAPPKLIVDDAL